MEIIDFSKFLFSTVARRTCPPFAVCAGQCQIRDCRRFRKLKTTTRVIKIKNGTQIILLFDLAELANILESTSTYDLVLTVLHPFLNNVTVCTSRVGLSSILGRFDCFFFCLTDLICIQLYRSYLAEVSDVLAAVT